MTKFSFEVPLEHLEEFDEYQDYYFALSFLCRESNYYFEYMKDKVQQGRTTVLDNSYNELDKPDSSRELAEMFYKVGAHRVVSPDSDKWSSERLNRSYSEMISLVPQEKVWVVVRNQEEYDSFSHAKRCSTFLHRPTKEILQRCPHYLGLASMQEIIKYQPVSCDTSMPIKLALKGRTVEQWIKEGCPHYHTREWSNFFDLPLSDWQVRLAKENICKIKKLAKEGTVKDVP